MKKNDFIHLRVDGEDRRFIEFLAEKQDATKSDVVRDIIRTFRMEHESRILVDVVQGDFRVIVMKAADEELMKSVPQNKHTL